MFSISRRLSALAVLLAVVPFAWADDDEVEVLAPPARAVRDHMDLFSAEARTKANLAVAELRTRYKTDLIVETAKTPDLPKGVDAGDPKAVRGFLDGYAKGRAKDLMGASGIFISIFPESKVTYCLVGPATLKAKLFTEAKADELRNVVNKKLAAKAFDAALDDAITFVRKTLPAFKDPTVKTDSDSWFGRTKDEEPEPAVVPPAPTGTKKSDSPSPTTRATKKSSPAAAAAPIAGGDDKPTPWLTYALIALGVFVGLWLLMAIIRGFSSAGAGGTPGMAGGGGGGGGSSWGDAGGDAGGGGGDWGGGGGGDWGGGGGDWGGGGGDWG